MDPGEGGKWLRYCPYVLYVWSDLDLHTYGQYLLGQTLMAGAEVSWLLLLLLF